MALPWSTLRGRFEATIRSASTPRHFQCLRDSWPSLRPFATVDELLGYLGEDLSADLDMKDQLYSHLVSSARAGEPASPLAHALLWIGLWPGLSATFFRRLWFWRDYPSELVSEMTNAFTTLVARLDFARVRKVVGTLIRSTEREVIQADLARRTEHIEVVERDAAFCEAKVTSAPDESESALFAALRRLVGGRESDCVLQALVLGEGPHYVSAASGLKPAAARQRLFRARRRIRALLVGTGVTR